MKPEGQETVICQLEFPTEDDRAGITGVIEPCSKFSKKTDGITIDAICKVLPEKKSN